MELLNMDTRAAAAQIRDLFVSYAPSPDISNSVSLKRVDNFAHHF